MQISLQPPTRGAEWRRRLLALVMSSLLAGCATQSDFGEVRPSLVNDDVHSWLGLEATAGQPSSFYLTDDERQLRDLAFPLIEAPYHRQRWFSFAAEWGTIGSDRRPGFDRTAYANHLTSKYFRSVSARYSRLIDDIRNDSTRLPQFFETAGRVLDIDQKRRKSLAFIPEVSSGERQDALVRVRENAQLVAMVRASLNQRVAAYRFALERLVIMTPTTQAVEAERSLNQLQALMARYSTQPAPTWTRERSLATER